jgi:hypothetical protein
VKLLRVFRGIVALVSRSAGDGLLSRGLNPGGSEYVFKA